MAEAVWQADAGAEEQAAAKEPQRVGAGARELVGRRGDGLSPPN